jgi:hypothetical protein
MSSLTLNDNLVEIEYWVNQMLPVEGLLMVNYSEGFRFQISIHLLSKGMQSTELSTVTLSNEGKSLVTRELSLLESKSILQKISCLKLSFDQLESFDSFICPSTYYGLRIRRGTVLMEFSWSDSEYITNDKALIDALTDLVSEISNLESVQSYEKELGIFKAFL